MESMPMEEQPYLFWVAGAQSLLAGVACGSLALFLSDHILSDKNEADSHAILTGLIIMMIPLMVSLLNRFAAGRGSMYSNSILTEGVAVSLFLIFLRYETDYILTGSRWALLGAVICAFTGVSLRKQMYVLVALIVAGGILKAVIPVQPAARPDRRSAILNCILVPVLSAIFVIVSAILFDCTYNYVMRGAFIRHTEGNRFVSTIAFYTTDREFAEYIDPELRDLYLEIYDTCDAEGYLMHDELSGWMERVMHFADNYDHIQLDVMEVVLERDADALLYMPLQEARTHTERMDMVRDAFNRSLLPYESDRILRIFVNNYISGLVLTVAKLHPVLCVYSIVAYAVYIALLVICIRRLIRVKHKAKESASAHVEGGTGSAAPGDTAAVAFAALVLISILLNTGLVSAVIFCQTRYMIYNMAPFYMAVVAMISRLRRKSERTVPGDSDVIY